MTRHYRKKTRSLQHHRANKEPNNKSVRPSDLHAKPIENSRDAERKIIQWSGWALALDKAQIALPRGSGGLLGTGPPQYCRRESRPTPFLSIAAVAATAATTVVIYSGSQSGVITLRDLRGLETVIAFHFFLLMLVFLAVPVGFVFVLCCTGRKWP